MDDILLKAWLYSDDILVLNLIYAHDKMLYAQNIKGIGFYEKENNKKTLVLLLSMWYIIKVAAEKRHNTKNKFLENWTVTLECVRV